MLLLAPPGAGKGTQGERLAAWLGVRHIAAGDLLRAEAQAGTARGREIAACQARGDLVPDQIVFGLLIPVVVEAAARSGSLITADLAADLGRDLGAVPGPVTSRASAGPNELLAGGACVVRDAQDVLDAMLGFGLPVRGPSAARRGRRTSCEIRAALPMLLASSDR